MNLCSALDALLVVINGWEKWIDFVKIKFHLNENVEWNCMQFELNWIYILKFKCIELKFKCIELKRNGMQIDAKDIENLLVACDCGVEIFFGKDIFSFLFTWKSIK